MIVKKEWIAMLLAGGQGSRLHALTRDIAKPAVPFGEEKDSKIEKMDLEYIIDLHGHYYHKDGSPVSISELNSIPERIYEKVKNHFEQTHTGKRFDDYITIQNNNLFSFGTNRILTGI